MITGESKTVPRGAGSKVIAGTVASRGSLRLRITAVEDQTALSGIMRLVATAQASGSRAQALADRAAAILFYWQSSLARLLSPTGGFQATKNTP